MSAHCLHARPLFFPKALLDCLAAFFEIQRSLEPKAGCSFQIKAKLQALFSFQLATSCFFIDTSTVQL
jgi:hypothetical protein